MTHNKPQRPETKVQFPETGKIRKQNGKTAPRSRTGFSLQTEISE